MLPSTHYQHSGKAPVGGIVLTLVGGLVAGGLLGAIYGFLVYWSPLVYVNAIATFGLGIVLATVVGSIGKVGKIRNATVITLLALVVAVTAYFAHWVVWVERTSGAQMLAPDQLWQFMSAVAEIGPWSIFGWTPTGAALWGIWGVEALLIVGLGTVSARGVIDVPFCETTGQWATEVTLPQHFAVIDGSRSLDTPQSLLEALKPATEPDPTYTQVSVATAEGSELRCVSLAVVEIEQKDDKEEATTTDIVRNMLFDRDSFDKLMGLSNPATA